MEAEAGREVQRCAPNAALLLAKAVLRYGTSRRPMGKRPPAGTSIPSSPQSNQL